MNVERTCIGCRTRDDRHRLLRVVVEKPLAPTPRIIPDPGSRLGGRGAWIHPDRDCLEQAERRRAFSRALRVAGPVEITDAVTSIVAHSRQLLSTEVGND